MYYRSVKNKKSKERRREPSIAQMTLLMLMLILSFTFSQSTMGSRKSMDRQEDVPMARTIAPSPLKLSTNALYIASITAFVVSTLALSLGISYVACALPLPVSLCHMPSIFTDDVDGDFSACMQ